jgi:hypothetical protein
VIKIPRKFVEKEDVILKKKLIATSSNSPQILNYLKDSKANRIGSVLCSYRLIAAHFPNRPDLHLRQGVIHSALQAFH